VSGPHVSSASYAGTGLFLGIRYPPLTGTSTLLRLLSGRTPPQNDAQVTFNGTPWRALARPADTDGTLGVNLQRLSAYAPESDVHLPFLTVRETFTFAHSALLPRGLPLHDPAIYRPSPPAEDARFVVPSRAAGKKVPGSGAGHYAAVPQGEANGAPPAVAVPMGGGATGAPDGSSGSTDPPDRPRDPEEMMDILRLRVAADTIIGSQFVRGVSGESHSGERESAAEVVVPSI
jgi:hypothetical protein